MAKQESGLKSAWELALERMERKDGPIATLSDEQKAALAEIESRARAQVAEMEIAMGGPIASVRAEGDGKKTEELEAEMRRRIAKIRDDAEAEKERIRSGAA